MRPFPDARFDTHAHVWDLDESRYPWMPVPPATSIPDRPAQAASLITAMDNAGVSSCVLIQPSTYGWRNDHILDVVARHPNRFLAVVLVDPADPTSPDTLAQLATNPAVRGVRFHVLDRPQVTTFQATGTSLLAAAFAVGLVVTVQVRADLIPLIADILRQAENPGAVVIDHLGLVRPGDRDGRSKLLALADHPSVFVKLSGADVLSDQAYPFTDCAPLAHAVVQRFGPERVMWGSNFPHVLARCDMQQVVELVQHLLPDLSGQERAQIEYQTAYDLWVPKSYGSKDRSARENNGAGP